MNQIGPTVRRLREKKGWTQEQLVAHCHLLGWEISRGTLAKMESQVRRITDIEIVLLAQSLKVSINQLFDS
jgi:transcriptional regulator with XRE-family HTH domain